MATVRAYRGFTEGTGFDMTKTKIISTVENGVWKDYTASKMVIKSLYGTTHTYTGNFAYDYWSIHFVSGTVASFSETTTDGETIWSVSGLNFPLSKYYPYTPSNEAGLRAALFAYGDTINGSAYQDVLYGYGGNDKLTGGAGSDTLVGGTGNDTYVLDTPSDVVTEYAGQGTDLVNASFHYTLETNVENLTLTGTGNINGFGNTLRNVLKGNSGKNWLNGGAGADTMAGGSGDDTYVLDNAGDVVTEALNAGTDTVMSSASYALGANLENLTLFGTAAINGTGNSLANVLTGNSGRNVLNGGSGNDTLRGGAGDDTLNGGAGADQLVGGAGNDTYVVDNAGDIVMEASSEGKDTVQSAVSYTLRVNLENLTLTGTAAINGTGNTLNNVLLGNVAANTLNGGSGNDTLDGGAGADRMAGGSGNDIYYVDNAGDVVTESTFGGMDKVYSPISYTLGANVEYLTLTGTATSGTGNSLANVLTGNLMNNVLNGRDGDDVLYGGNGADTLFGGLDDDVLYGGSGSDVLNGSNGLDKMAGGSGSDVYYVHDAGDVVTELAGEGIDMVYSSVSHTMGANVEYMALTGIADINGVGNALNNAMTGTSGKNSLSGLAGNDSMYGYAGNDILTGGAGNDSLVGGAGNDTMCGGAGVDLYSFSGAFGHDWIGIDGTNPNSQDKVQFAGLTHSQVTAALQGNDLMLTYGTGNDVRIDEWKASANNRLNTFQFTDGAYSYTGTAWKVV